MVKVKFIYTAQNHKSPFASSHNDNNFECSVLNLYNGRYPGGLSPCTWPAYMTEYSVNLSTWPVTYKSFRFSCNNHVIVVRVEIVFIHCSHKRILSGLLSCRWKRDLWDNSTVWHADWCHWNLILYITVSK